jgi:DNA-directed RNA polymerase
MNTAIEQYALETSWSTRITDEIVLEAIQGAFPFSMELGMLEAITDLNRGKVSNKEIFIKFFSIILKDKIARPIQAVATQLGHIAGIKDSAEAFEWGILLVKECKDSGLYALQEIDEDWYVHPNFTLDKKTQQKLAKLQYLPPMKTLPVPWANNRNGGWLFETKHLVLGNRFTKHDEPLAYDVINKLQSIPWEVDPITYKIEKQTNRVMNKKKFLRVIKEYLGVPFHFVWRYDSRGRSYSSGYDLNLQSNEYGKALLSLHKKELITPAGKHNLHIALANHAGKDKLTWIERNDWARYQEANNCWDTDGWKEPVLGRKAIRALKDTQVGKPTGYVMSLDATASGLQVMAAVSGCKQTAKLVNMIDSATRYDLYTEIADLMNMQLPKPVPRKIVKQAAMTHYYNSKATPKALLKKNELPVFYNVITGLLPGAEHVMDIINACWNCNADHHTWVMPDGHTVYIPVIEGINGKYADPELGEIPLRWYHQTKSENFRSLCPNIVHSIDGYVAREMVRRCDFQLSHVHDCFVFNPNHLSKVTTTYRRIMAEIAKGELFRDILRQITGDNTMQITKASNDLDQDILNSNYMLS